MKGFSFTLKTFPRYWNNKIKNSLERTLTNNKAWYICMKCGSETLTLRLLTLQINKSDYFFYFTPSIKVVDFI